MLYAEPLPEGAWDSTAVTKTADIKISHKAKWDFESFGDMPLPDFSL